jgi:hypothetical protein
MNIQPIASIASIALVAALAGCASTQPAATSPAAQPQAAAPGTAANAPRIVKSRDGRFDGELVGTPAAGSKFAKLQIGMEMNEVFKLIGAGDNMTSNETGKRWIPFYFGNDARRVQVAYANEGCLTFTGGNIYGAGGNELIRITVDPKGVCGD